MPGSTASLESLSSPSPTPPLPEVQHSNNGHDGGLDSGSELSELTEEEQDNDNHANEDDTDRSAARKKKQRGHIVPEPMWNWAMRKKKPEKKDWDSKFEEEEEEEQAGPAKAMEEEEGDDEDKVARSDRDVSLDKDDALTDNEVADDDDDDPPEDEGESGDEAPPHIPRKDAPEDVSGDEQDDPEYADNDEPDIQQSPKPVASPDLTDDENEDVGEEEIEEEDVQDAEPATKEASEVDEEEEDIVPDDVEVPDVDEAPTTGVVTPANGIEDVVDADADATMDVDAQPTVLMSPVAVAASSIMAGASLLQPASPSSSQPSTPSGSRASSRFPSAEPEQEQDVPSEPEAEPEPERRAGGGRGGRARKGKGRTRAPRRSRAAVAADAEVDDLDNVDLGEGEGGDADDDAATPDVDLDSDMQPAHRAEALDVLATIELKFALLRERLYVEKMDSLAWEEGLIADGTHPELLHLHTELSNRRDKRLELATRRRDYEIENVRKRRRLDEAGAWSTWKNDRDELQKTMIAETNGKKRRLERERRSIERPPPTRRFPIPLHEVPPAPTLREIVKNSPFGVPDSASSLGKRSRKKEASSHVPLAYPTLEPLSRHEIIQDLEMFWQHHRNAPIGYNPHSHIPGLMNAVLGGGMPHGMDPYAMGMPVIDGPGPARFVQQPHVPQQGMVQNFGPHPRLPHHHSAPPGGLPHLSHAQQVQLEQELQAGMRQPSGMPPHPSQFGPGPGPGALLRRSISPVPLSNGAGPSSSVPTTLGGGPVPPGFAGPKPNGWSGPQPSAKESKRMNGEADVRERERMAEVMAQRERAERERAQRDLDREREREAERAYHMSHSQPRHNAHTHQHPVHSAAPGQAAHHHGPHHPHHHHHVHHHHHPPPQGFNGPGSSAHAPPMTGLPSGSNPGPANPSLSPHTVREFEQRRSRSGAPTEVIELSAPTQKQTASPGMSAFWLGNEEPLPSGNDHPRERERERERGRAPGPLGPPQPGPNERLMTPFTMGPSQTLQRSLPGSPRNPLGGAGPSNPPPSMPSSRRGSWSMAAEDARPSSASHRPAEPGHPMAGSSGSQRPSSTRLPQPPSTSAYHTPFGSPPRNGRPLPPGSPSGTPFSGPLRSPVRGQQGRVPIGGPGPLSPPPSLPLSPRGMGSPGSKLLRMPSPPLTRTPLPKLGGFPIPESGNIAPIMSATSGTMPPAPSTLLPPLSASLPPPGAPTARMANGPLSEKAPQLPPAKAVPVSVDGP